MVEISNNVRMALGRQRLSKLVLVSLFSSMVKIFLCDLRVLVLKSLILGRLLRAIHDDGVDRAFDGIESKTELFAKRCED